jgi:hypothetical protein
MRETKGEIEYMRGLRRGRAVVKAMAVVVIVILLHSWL